jgi:hypothetical protein
MGRNDLNAGMLPSLYLSKDKSAMKLLAVLPATTETQLLCICCCLQVLKLVSDTGKDQDKHVKAAKQVGGGGSRVGIVSGCYLLCARQSC